MNTVAVCMPIILVWMGTNLTCYISNQLNPRHPPSSPTSPPRFDFSACNLPAPFGNTLPRTPLDFPQLLNFDPDPTWPSLFFPVPPCQGGWNGPRTRSTTNIPLLWPGDKSTNKPRNKGTNREQTENKWRKSEDVLVAIVVNFKRATNRKCACHFQ